MSYPTNFTLELGQEKPPSTCECCGNLLRSVHGFIYKSMDAYAVYLACWTEGHTESGVSLAIGLGEWNDDAGPEQRTSVGLECRASNNQYLFSILEPMDSPWSKTKFIGQMMTREQTLKSELKDDFLAVAEFITLNDARLSRGLEHLAPNHLN